MVLICLFPSRKSDQNSSLKDYKLISTFTSFLDLLNKSSYQNYPQSGSYLNDTWALEWIMIHVTIDL